VLLLVESPLFTLIGPTVEDEPDDAIEVEADEEAEDALEEEFEEFDDPPPDGFSHSKVWPFSTTTAPIPPAPGWLVVPLATCTQLPEQAGHANAVVVVTMATTMRVIKRSDFMVFPLAWWFLIF
jgi:hypothetical protein